MEPSIKVVNAETNIDYIKFRKGINFHSNLEGNSNLDRKRTVWVIHKLNDLKIVEKISPCSIILAAPFESEEQFAPITIPFQYKKYLKNGKLTLIISPDAKVQAQALAGLIDIEKFDSWEPLIDEGTLTRNTNEVREFYKIIGEQLNIRNLNKSTNLIMSKYFVRNTLINAPLALKTIQLSSRKESSSENPVLIVATGPSLDKQLPILKKYQDLYTIIAVDTAWPILSKNSITPDYLVALDPTSQPSWELNSIDENTFFTVDAGCAPGLVWSNDKNHVFTASYEPSARILSRMGIAIERMETGGSVATTAFNIGRHLGGKPIILIGQDLALTDGRDHAEGYLFKYAENVLDRAKKTGFMVEGYHGDQVETERQLLYYKLWYENVIAASPDLMVINATEGGAKISGCLQIPFDTVSKELKQFIKKAKTKNSIEQPEIDKEKLSALIDNISTLISDAQEYISLAKSGEFIASTFEKKTQNLVFDEIDDINQRILSYDATTRFVVDVFSTRFMENVRKTTKQDSTRKSAKRALDKYGSIYKEIQKSGRECIAMLKRIRDFYEELQNSSDSRDTLIKELMEDEAVKF